MKRESVIVALATALVGGLRAGSLAMAQAKPEDTELWMPALAEVSPPPEGAGPSSDAVAQSDGDDLDLWVSTEDKSPDG